MIHIFIKNLILFLHVFAEVFLIAIVADYFLSYVWHTRTTEALMIMAGSFFVFLASEFLDMFALSILSYNIMSLSPIIIPILFQQEIKNALGSMIGKPKKGITVDSEKFCNDLTEAVFRMTKKKLGALVVIEQNCSLEFLRKKSVEIDASFSPQLLECIFSHNSPIHDGSVVINNFRIVAASVILPLYEYDDIKCLKKKGTRHRAGIGISRECDVIVIIVSEENGDVSIVNQDKIIMDLTPIKFKNTLQQMLNT